MGYGNQKRNMGPYANIFQFKKGMWRSFYSPHTLFINWLLGKLAYRTVNPVAAWSLLHNRTKGSLATRWLIQIQIVAKSEPENLCFRFINSMSLANSSKNAGVMYRCNSSANGCNSSWIERFIKNVILSHLAC